MVVPVTLTDTAHEPLAATVPPDRLTVVAPAEAVAVPPQVLLRLGVPATTSPAGRLSVKATPVDGAVFGLEMAKLKVVVPFSGIVAAPNVLVIETGLATLKFAEAVFPVPPLVEVTAPVVLVYWPDAAPVTVTLNWHVPFAAMVAPDRAMPVGAVVVKVPPQTVAVLLATLSPVGRVSVKATPLRATLLAAGLVMVKFSEVVAPREMAEGLKTLAIEGAATTVMLAEAAGPLPPSLELIVLVVLFCTPAAVPVTFTLKVQELLAVSVAPDKLITFVFCVAVIVPLPHEPVRPLGVEIIRPAGKVSLNPIPLSETLFPFWTLKLRLVEPFTGMLAAPNDLLRLGGPTTERLAFEVLPVPPLVELI